MSLPRYAIYFAPDPTSELWRRGSCWLGRNAATGRAVARRPDGALASLRPERITRTPAKYGFHATLKPPFSLPAEETETRLLASAAEFANRHAPIVLAEGLRVSSIGSFVALVPVGDVTEVNHLASACVRELDGFRGPPGRDELSRRRQAALTPRQTDLLERWGYPYVMEEFRFHMTLTGDLPSPEREKACSVLAEHFASIAGAPVAIDTIAIFHQASGDLPFRIIARLPLTGR